MKYKKIFLGVISFSIFVVFLTACGSFSTQKATNPTAASTPTVAPVTLTPSVTLIPTDQTVVAPSAGTKPTAVQTVVQVKQPPECIFPMAQTIATEFEPKPYTFSEPKVVLTASSNFDSIDINEWLPDNRRVLNYKRYFSQRPTIYRDLDSQSGNTQIYAIRPTTLDAPPAWVAQLNAVIYPAQNIVSVDNIHHHTEITRQAWISQGDPTKTKLVADNMEQYYIVVKPDGSQVTFQTGKQISKLNATTASLPSLPSLSFDLTQWATPDASFYAAWRPGASQVFLYNTSFVPSIPGYTFLMNTDNGQICNIDLSSIANDRAWAGVARWSSDGRYLAVIRASGSLSINYTDLGVLDTATGKLFTMDMIHRKNREFISSMILPGHLTTAT